MGVTLLSVRHLTTAFHTEQGLRRAVNDVCFEVEPQATVAMVGESGSGKTVTALSILRLLPAPPAEILGGAVFLHDRDLLLLPEREMRKVRGAQVSMVFQEPLTALNPVYSVGSQIAEAVRIHQQLTRRQARERAVEMLAMVGIASARERANAYPHELSGGMRQRVMIAMALSCHPQVLLADEPTTALDVSIQAQILELLQRLQEELSMSILFITHDLGVVAQFASTLVIMYAGQVVETGPVGPIYAEPLHPYTRALLACVPPLGTSRGARPRRLQAIEGVMPASEDLPPGCRFAPRCTLYAAHPPGYERCVTNQPELLSVDGQRRVRCHFAPVAA